MEESDFIEDLTVKEDRLRKKLQKKIISCYNCQPYDSGEPVWIHGDPIEIEELLYELKIDEKYWDKILPHIHCPCGTQITRGSDVGVKTQYQKDLDNFIKNSNKAFKRNIKTFRQLLEKTPFLGYKDPMGRKIYKELKEKKFPVTSLNTREKFFRARKVTSHDILESEQMLNAPKGKPSEGRFNHSGQSHLYISKSIETAIKEVAQNHQNFLVWVQEFEFENSINNILDLTFDVSNIALSSNPLLLSLTISNSLEKFENNLDFWRPDYFMTRYIMDCAKDLGYSGIKYNSTRNSYDDNIVLFYPGKLKIKNIGEPKIEIFKNPENRIFDI